MNSKNSGVSEVITAILLITLVVSAMAVVGVFVSSIPAQTKQVPQISLQVCQDGPDHILLYHDGGDTLRSDEFLVNLTDSNKNLLKSLSGFDWSVGSSERISYEDGTEYVQFISKEGGGNRLIAWSSMRFCTACDVGASPDAFPRSIRPGETVQFTANLDSSITSWRWDFGDGSGSDEENPSHTYTANGMYTATLWVENYQCNRTYSIRITVGCPEPEARFTASPNPVNVNGIVTFSDTSTNSPTSWEWDFGDGGSSSDQNPTHPYSAVGSYTVTLRVTNVCGSSIATQEIVVSTCPAPTAAFTASRNPVTVNGIVTFTDGSTGTISSYEWTFGDGGTATGIGPHTHTYSAIGTYTATLTVTGPCGTSTTSHDIVVFTCTPPTADFTAVPDTGYAPLDVTFTNGSSGTISSYEWAFGDGGTATGIGPHTHSYTTAGTYTASLTVTGPCGTSTTTRQIVVSLCTSPTASFTAVPDTGNAPLDVTFTNGSSGTISSFQWNFGDGGTATGIGPHMHTYSAAGTYTATLMVTGDCGTSTTTRQITVIDCIPGIQGVYYPTRTFTGTPVSRVDTRLRLADAAAVATGEPTDEPNWPQATLGKQDQFSCDYQGSLLVPTTGTYTFTLRSDDGSYLWLGSTAITDTPFIDNGGDHAPRSVSGTISLTQGLHPIRVRMYENAGRAVLALLWSGPGFSQEYVDSFCLDCVRPTAGFTANPESGNAPLAVTFTDGSTGIISSYQWAFGDGETATGIGPHTHTYTTGGTYTASLTVTGPCGSDTTTRQIDVTACTPPTAAFTADPTSGYAPLDVTFTDSSSGTISTYEWIYGDGSPVESGIGPHTHTYSSEGTFTAYLTVSGPCGTSTTTHEIVVSSCTPPTAVFSANPTTGYAPLAVTFTNGSTGTITSWQWDFNGDGTVDSTVQNPPAYTYTTAGTYNAQLTVSGPCGSNSVTHPIVVSTCIPPTAVFSADSTSGYAPLVVTFTNGSTGTITSWQWDFNGDGTVDSTVQNPPAYTYTTAGTYNAQLTVSGPCGSNSVTHPIVVSTCTPPTAVFSADPTSGYAPLAVTFTNGSTGTITSWQWDFNGDGTVDSTVQNPPAYTYTTAGTFNAQLTVSGPCGSNSVTHPIVVSTCTPPTAVFSANPTTGYAPLVVTFTNGSTGTITSWQWDFNGDGTVDSTVQNPPAYTYTTAGTFNAQLTVSGPCGSNSVTHPVVVSTCPTPIAAFSANPTSGNAPLSVTFTDQSSGGTINAWQWNFGDGSANSTIQNPQHIFNNAGTYQVTLTAYNSCGNHASVSGTITVTSGYRIYGTKYNDYNGNGIQDTGEPGLSGWEIQLFDNEGSTYIGTQNTNATGYYEFSGLAQSSHYYIVETQKPYWKVTSPSSGSVGHIIINGGHPEQIVNFGNQKKPVGWWKFDGNTQDSSGYGNHGTGVSSSAYASGHTGASNTAFNFAGSRYVSVPDSRTLDATTGLTITGWVYFSSFPNYQYFLEKGYNDQEDNYGTFFSSSPQILLEWDPQGQNNVVSVNSGTQTFNTNTWYHIAIVVNGNSVTFWRNGALVATRNSSSLPLVPSTRPLRIGAQNYGSYNFYFSGRMDDVRIYNMALDSGEISYIYNS